MMAAILVCGASVFTSCSSSDSDESWSGGAETIENIVLTKVVE